VVAAGLAALSIRLSTRQAKANVEAIYRERRIDFYLERLRELIESIEKGPNVAFASAEAQRALRMLGREYALPFLERRTTSTRPTRTRRVASVAGGPPGASVDELGHGAAGDEGRGARSCAGCTVATSDGAGG